jgi:hypothetical protein
MFHFLQEVDVERKEKKKERPYRDTGMKVSPLV